MPKERTLGVNLPKYSPMNARGHAVLGALAGVAINGVFQNLEMKSDPTKKFDWAECAMSGVIGAGIGLVPDLLEPAVNPHHRQFFHSVAFGLLVMYACRGKHTAEYSRGMRALLLCVAGAYVSHLIADAMTPRGIRLL